MFLKRNTITEGLGGRGNRHGSGDTGLYQDRNVGGVDGRTQFAPTRETPRRWGHRFVPRPQCKRGYRFVPEPPRPLMRPPLPGGYPFLRKGGWQAINGEWGFRINKLWIENWHYEFYDCFGGGVGSTIYRDRKHGHHVWCPYERVDNVGVSGRTQFAPTEKTPICTKTAM